MIDLPLSEQELLADLLWEYGCDAGAHRSFDDYLARCPSLETRRQLFAQLLRSEMWQGSHDLTWLSERISQVDGESLRLDLIRDVYQDRLHLGTSPAWSECRVFDRPASALDLRDEGDPVYLGQRLAFDITIERRLGSGSFAVVYEAADQNGARFAVKILRPEFVTSNAFIRRSFLKEALRTASLPDSPGLPRLLDIRLINDLPKPLLVSCYRLKQGQTLSNWKKHFPERVTPRRCAHIIQSAARLLSALHARGLYHRDLSTSNILVDDADEVHLIDLGLSLAEHECRRTLSFAGTRRFSAPEHVSDGRFDGPLSDVFSLGCVLQDLMPLSTESAGRRPNEVRQFGELAMIARRACDPTAEKRFGSMLEFAEELARWAPTRIALTFETRRESCRIGLGMIDAARIKSVTDPLRDHADPEGDPSTMGGLARTMRADLTPALQLVDRLSGLRTGAVSSERTVMFGQEDGMELAQLMGLVASHMRIRGEWRRFLVFAERALVLGERYSMPQSDPRQYSIWLDNFAAHLIKHGRTADAINAARRCLQLRLDHFGSEQHFVHQAHNNYGEILREAGMIEAAEWHMRKYRQFVYQELGADSNSYGWGLSNKSQILLERREDEAAYFVATKALRVKEAALDSGHIQLCFVLNKLGIAATRLKAFGEADKHYSRALRIREEHYGIEHPLTVLTASLWAESWKERGSGAQAMKMCERILEHFPFGEINLHVRKALELCLQLSEGRKAGQYQLWLESVEAYQADEST